MNKRLSKFDIFVVLGFILSLGIGVAAFFYGLEVGKERTEAKYKILIEELSAEHKRDHVAYHQQQLVSFYHTVLQPVQEFRDTWFRHMRTIEAGGGATDGDALLKELKRLAEDISGRIQPTTIPDVSPLLQSSQKNYLRSLTLFADAAERLQNGPGGPRLAAAMRQDEIAQEAMTFALRAQAEFYEAIWMWHKQENPVLAGDDLIGKDDLTFQEWRSLPLTGKNLVLARLLSEIGAYEPFYPQDAAARIDELIATGRTEKLAVTSVKEALMTLISTGAVRADDYYLTKDKQYKNETLPQLPFFY